MIGMEHLNILLTTLGSTIVPMTYVDCFISLCVHAHASLPRILFQLINNEHVYVMITIMNYTVNEMTAFLTCLI